MHTHSHTHAHWHTDTDTHRSFRCFIYSPTLAHTHFYTSYWLFSRWSSCWCHTHTHTRTNVNTYTDTLTHLHWHTYSFTHLHTGLSFVGQAVVVTHHIHQHTPTHTHTQHTPTHTHTQHTPTHTHTHVHTYTQIIPSLVEQFKTLDISPVDGKQLTDAMHTQGSVCACDRERECVCVYVRVRDRSL